MNNKLTILFQKLSPLALKKTILRPLKRKFFELTRHDISRPIMQLDESQNSSLHDFIIPQERYKDAYFRYEILSQALNKIGYHI